MEPPSLEALFSSMWLKATPATKKHYLNLLGAQQDALEAINEAKNQVQKKDLALLFVAQQEVLVAQQEVLKTKNEVLETKNEALRTTVEVIRQANSSTVAQETPPASSTPKDMLDKMIEMIRSNTAHKCTVTINSDAYPAKKLLLDAIGIDSIEKCAEITEEFENANSEKKLQAVFDAHASTALGENYRPTPDGAKGTPFAASRAQSDHTHKNDNKPDGISLVAPIFAELKHGSVSKTSNILNNTDNKVLTQCLGRVGMLIQRVSFLQRMVGFGCCSDGAWLVFVALKNLEGSKIQAWHVYASRICLNDVFPLWKLCHETTRKSPSFFTSGYAATLAQTLQQYYNTKLPLEYFCVKWLASSSAGTVFLVAPPSKSNLPDDSISTLSKAPRRLNRLKKNVRPLQEVKLSDVKVVWDRRSKDAIVVKLQYGEEITAELSCLSDMHKLFNNHYAIAYYHDEKLARLAREEPEISLDVVHSVSEILSDDPPPQWRIGETDGCGIIMHHGMPLDKPGQSFLGKIRDKVPKDLTARKYYFKVIKDQTDLFLQTMHDADYVHRDIRLPNIMHFGDRGAQLIDYGFASKLTGECPILFPDGRVPSGILKHFSGYVKEDELTQGWTKELDFKMLEITMIRLKDSLEKNYDGDMNRIKLFQ